MSADKTFKCVVIAPQARLIDCVTDSVILPAHDGQVGVWHDHMAMFCEMGLGLMEVRKIAAEPDCLPTVIPLLIDGGFTLVSENTLTVIAYEAYCFHGEPPDKIEQILEKARKKLTAPTANNYLRQHDAAKLEFLEKLAQIEKTPGYKFTLSVDLASEA